ncbi:hypothetical protein [Nodosilinea sp. E11]|uniref:hypothetical protein n=1 Tax=Nodosilinea sp. E11 TaxID=3037479 RepID=UPI00293492E7|nr:hypothetical protein [Nodosilinea sp. E11]WOD37461.1 hypothetical protein RRF56_14730 [Nodosilinea sp. E11]
MMQYLKSLGLALGAAALIGAIAPAWVQASDDRVAAAEAAPTVPALETRSYTYADLFSIAFPVGWQIDERAEAPQVVAESTGANGHLPAIRTEVSWQNAPPRQVVGESLEALREKGYTVTRYDAATIDGVTAVRLWVSEIPDDLPNAFITYVGYPTATATITSYYGDTTGNMDPVLMGIHQSFARSSQ